jgi:hypothetical protein
MQLGIPKPSEKRAARRILERFRNLCLQGPIGRFPNLDSSVVRLSGKEFTDWIPADTLDEPLVLVQLSNAF